MRAARAGREGEAQTARAARLFSALDQLILNIQIHPICYFSLQE